jgi:hypothetical protein
MRLLSHTVGVASAIRVLATSCLFVHGCVHADGGAVELSWALRSASGATADFLDCPGTVLPSVPVKAIRLDWEVGSVASSTSWSCEDGHGVTGFDLPEGQALLSVKPVCLDGSVATTGFTAPAPELRRVNVGNTISLGAVELVLQVTACSTQHPCICQ